MGSFATLARASRRLFRLALEDSHNRPHGYVCGAILRVVDHVRLLRFTVPGEMRWRFRRLPVVTCQQLEALQPRRLERRPPQGGERLA